MNTKNQAIYIRWIISIIGGVAITAMLFEINAPYVFFLGFIIGALFGGAHDTGFIDATLIFTAIIYALIIYGVLSLLLRMRTRS